MTYDFVDLKILEELQADGRLPITALSERVGLLRSACRNRVRRMEQEGVIEGYVAVIEPNALARCLKVFLRVHMDRASAALRADFEALVDKLPDIQTCHLMANQCDYLLFAVVRDTDALRDLLTEVLINVPGVSLVESDLTIRTVKNETNLPLQHLFAGKE